MTGEARHGAPLFVPPGAGGVKADADATGGVLGLVETVIAAGHSAPLHVPRGIPHTFLGLREEPARVLVLLLPGGLEEAFADPARFDELLARHGVEVVGPPLGQARDAGP